VSEFELELVEERARDLYEELACLGYLGELTTAMLLDGLACAGLTLCLDQDNESSRAFLTMYARQWQRLLGDE
jgi:hypothetical protein